MNTPMNVQDFASVAKTRSSEFARGIVRNIFARKSQVLIDTCVVYMMHDAVIIKRIMRDPKSDLSDLEASIAFLDELNAHLPLYHEQIFVFPELYCEYKKTTTVMENQGRYAIRVAKENQLANAEEISKRFEAYLRKIRRTNHLAKRYCKPADFDPVAEQFKDLLLYLNQRFEWKDEDSKIKTDEKIIAYAVINSMINSPTTIYTRDRGICHLTRKGLSFLTSNALMGSEYISQDALRFIRRLKNADVKVSRCFFSKSEFFIEVDNQKGVQAASSHYGFKPSIRCNAPYILRMVSERLTDIVNTEYFRRTSGGTTGEKNEYRR